MTDTELVTEAIRKAGTQKALAKIFGVAQPAISAWGRIRPIPRHVRPRLEDYVRGTRLMTEEASGGGRTGALEPDGTLSAIRDLLQFLERNPRGRPSDLPRAYQQRYERRLNELVAWVKRELDEYRRFLETEYMAEAGKRRRKTWRKP